MLDKLVSAIRFPLYSDDKKPSVKLNQTQRNALKLFQEKVNTREYTLVKKSCLCGKKEKDIVISEKDRYGISVKNALCLNCGLIRSLFVLDSVSLLKFYKEVYRDLYELSSVEGLFEQQVFNGNLILKLVKDHNVFDEIQTVCDMGCATGGTLYPFYKIKKNVIGLDYDKRYMQYGQKKGMKLVSEKLGYIEDESVDLFILNHVFEHFLNPIDELLAILKKVRCGKYLFIEVPGIFYIEKGYYDPILFFQNAHIYNYYEYFLRCLFHQVGITVLFGNERCRFLLQKPKDWRCDGGNSSVSGEKLEAYAKEIQFYLKKCYIKNLFFMYKDKNIALLKRPFGLFLDKLNLKSLVKKWMGIKDYSFLED